MSSNRTPISFLALAAMAILTSAASRAMALTQVLDATINVVQLDNSTSGNNNAVALADSPGAVSVSASGTSIFGSLAGEQYNSLAVEYRDANNKIQYGSVPSNGSKSFSGNHDDFGFLTDNLGDVPNNSGSTLVSEQNASNATIASGTIFAGSLTPAETGVAQLVGGPSGNAAVFDTLNTLQNYSVSVSGSATYDAAGDQYGSVVVQYRDAGNGISYDTLPIGTSKIYFGFRFRIFITDFTGQLSDNSGSLTVDVVPIPEPASLVLAAMGFAAVGLWYRQHK